MSSEAPSDPTDSAHRAAEILKDNVPENVQMKVLGLVGRSLHIHPSALPCVDLEGSTAYAPFSITTLDFVILSHALDFGGPDGVRLDFAILPHAGRHPHAGALECETEAREWKWVAQQVRECMPDPAWKPAAILGKNRVAFPETMRRLGRHLYPVKCPIGHVLERIRNAANHL